MATDPKARRISVGYEGGTVTGPIGLMEWLFETGQPQWGSGSIATTQLGRRRYKYGTKTRSAAAAGKEVILDCGVNGKYTVRVTGDIVDFIDVVVAKTSGKVLQAFTRRGTIYAPTLPNLA